MIYGYLCEDAALQYFLYEVLKKIGPETKCKNFERHEDFCERFKTDSGRNSNQVRKLFADAAKIARAQYQIDLFIVAYDYDNGDFKQYGSVIKNNLLSIANVKVRNRTTFSIPDQCIEYWLWYIKYDSGTNPAQPNSLESDKSFSRHKAKAEVYDKPLEDGKYTGQSNETELKKAKEILKNINVDRLQELSPSFKHFVEQIKNFCNQFAGK